MRFQTTKRIQGRDPELVLGVLEGCLRSISNEIARQGSQITLLGLGPSPRAINRRDTTVIDVQREEGATVIHADVQFQASAFLGTVAQDEVVREKLDRLFDDMLAELGIPTQASESEMTQAGEPAEAVAAELEVVAQQRPTETLIEEPPVPEIVTVSAADATGTPDSTQELVSGPRADAEPSAAATEGPEIVAEPETAMPDAEVQPEPPSAQPARQEQPPVFVAPEGAATSLAAVNDAVDPLSVVMDTADKQETRTEIAETLTGPEAKQPEVVEAFDTTHANGPAKVAEDGAAAQVETVSAKVDPAKAEVARTAHVTEPEATPGIDAIKEAAAQAGAPAETNNVAPLPPAEAAKAIRAPVTKTERPAKLWPLASEESGLVPAIEKPEATPLSASKTSVPLSNSSPARASKPVFSKVTAPPIALAVPAPPAATKEMFGVSAFEDEPETSSKLLRWSAWVAALIVLVVAPLVWLYLPSHPGTATAPVTQPAAAAPAEPLATPKQPWEDPDPAVVVDDWAAAMNSRDAAAQAAFYANPVERYFLRHNLTRAEVKADKQAAIDRRKGDWAVKMESVKVTRANDKTAKARLIKHYTVKEDGKTASEWFVPSALQMTRANGRWQITSERDLGWGTSLDELEY